MNLFPLTVDGPLASLQSVVVRVICILGFTDDEVKATVIGGGGVVLFLKLLYSDNVEIQVGEKQRWIGGFI